MSRTVKNLNDFGYQPEPEQEPSVALPGVEFGGERVRPSDAAMTWEEIGRELGMTAQGAQFIGERALAKLRRQPEAVAVYCVNCRIYTATSALIGRRFMNGEFAAKVNSLTRTERFMATVYAMNSLLMGTAYTREEFEGKFIDWVGKEAKEVERLMKADPRKILTRSEVVDAVATRFGLSAKSLFSHNQTHAICVPRSLVMYLLHTLAGFSMAYIGKTYGFHHTSVMAACRRMAKRIAEDKDFAVTVEAIKADLQ